MKYVLLIRHGQTDWNVEGRWQGMVDIPLNETGREQARQLAAHLKGRKLNAVYSSDLQRAAETARIIGEAVGLTPKTDERLREMHLGVFQGLTHAEQSAKFPELVIDMRKNYLDFQVPEGETRRQMQTRAYTALMEIVTNESDGEIALVTHGGVIRMLLLKLFGDLPEFHNKSVFNTSVTEISYDGTKWELVDLAAFTHLGEIY